MTMVAQPLGWVDARASTGPTASKDVDELSQGTIGLTDLVAAAALANAETFGGQDYVGYHAEMALLPALQISEELPAPEKPLPVLKVLYRNSGRIQQFGPTKKTLAPIEGVANQVVSVDRFGPELRQLVRQADMDKAEQLFATLHQNDPSLAFDTLLYTIADEVDVHRFVLAYRGMGLIDVAGKSTRTRCSDNVCGIASTLKSVGKMKAVRHRQFANTFRNYWTNSSS